MGGVTPPVFSDLQESWSKGSYTARELATAFSVTFFLSNNTWSIGQNAPQHIMSRHITASIPVVFNLSAGTEPQGCIPVARGTLFHISAQESYNILSLVAFS